MSAKVVLDRATPSPDQPVAPQAEGYDIVCKEACLSMSVYVSVCRRTWAHMCACL